MKKSLLIALFAVLPVMAQDCPDKPECAPRHHYCFGKMHRPQLTEEQKAEMKAKFEARKAEMLAKFDTNKDGQLSDDERKAAHEARKAAFEAKLLEKFDADKDGKLSDAEKENIKADFAKHAPKFHKHGPKGPRCCGPKGPRPQLTEEQKAQFKAKFEARKAEMLAKFDADKDGKLSEEERKAAREARKAEMKAKFMEKFDTDKDGQISDAEKAAVKDEFGKRGHRRGQKGCCPGCRK